MAYVFPRATLSLGMAMWATMQRIVWSYEMELVDKVFCLIQGKLSFSLMSQTYCPRKVDGMQPIWEILSTTTMWYIWKDRCTFVMGNTRISNVKSIVSYW